jgi:hypothetical protein
MSIVAPVTAVLVIRWTARTATSAGPTTRPIGRVVRSCSRRASSWSPSSEADSGVQAIRVARREDHVGSLGAGEPGRFEPDA